MSRSRRKQREKEKIRKKAEAKLIHKKKVKKVYDQKTIQAYQEAIALMNEHGTTSKEASIQFKLNHSMLKSTSQNQGPVYYQIKIKTLLTDSEESDLVEWIYYRARRGFPANRAEVTHKVQNLIAGTPREHQFVSQFRKDWYHYLMEKYENLVRCIAPEFGNSAPDKKEEVRLWVDNVKEHLETNNLSNISPDRIFYIDKTVLNWKIVDREEENATPEKEIEWIKNYLDMFWAASASGKLLMPMLFFEENDGHIFEKDFEFCWAVEASADSFFKYVTETFFTYLKNNNCEFPVILYANLPTSHFTQQLIKFCKQNQIELIKSSFPIVQPLEIAFFPDLMKKFAEIKEHWEFQNQVKKFSESMCPTVLRLTLDSEDFTQEIVIGFQKSGFYPFNPSMVEFNFNENSGAQNSSFISCEASGSTSNESTFQNCAYNKAPMDFQVDPKTLLTSSQEKDLVDWILYRAKRGFPVTKRDIDFSVKELVSKSPEKIMLNFGDFQKKGYHNFLNKYPNIHGCIAKNLLPITRRGGTQEKEELNHWFTSIQQHFQTNNLCNIGPGRIFNLDETLLRWNNISLEEEKQEEKNFKRKREGGLHFEDPWIILSIASASGSILEPMVLLDNGTLRHKNFSENLTVGMLSDRYGSFYKYITEIFLTHLKKNNIELPVILYANGGSAHFNVSIIKFCQRNQIELIRLIPNSLNIYRPQSITFFPTLKKKFREIKEKFRLKNNDCTITKSMFPALLKSTLESIDCTLDIVNGFKKSGLFSFDLSANDYNNILQNAIETQNCKNYCEENNSTIIQNVLQSMHNEVSMDFQVNPKSILTYSEEKELVQWILYRAERGYPPKICDIQSTVERISKKKFSDTDKFIKEWLEYFAGRHKTVNSCVAESIFNPLDPKRQMKQWFDKIDKFLKVKNLCNISPDRIFNLDKTSIRWNYVSSEEEEEDLEELKIKQIKYIYNKDFLTVLTITAANGEIIPPMVIFDHETYNDESTSDNNMPKGWSMGKITKNCPTSTNFFDYIKNTLRPHLRKKNCELPIILYVNGPSSLFTLPLIKFCKINLIELVRTFPSSYSVHQPQQVSFFPDLIKKFSVIKDQWRFENHVENLTRSMFPAILKFTLESTDFTQAIVNGFKVCGLSPFNPNVEYNNLSINVEGKQSEKKNSSSFQNTTQSFKFLEFMEANLIDSLTLENFRKNEKEEIWSGDEKHWGLFEAWRKLRRYCNFQTD